MKRRCNHGERGFALLLVFLLAAAIALMFYQQMPRVAFEAQRDKEQLLEDRGHEYIRGIQMYFVQFKKYPSKIEDLESTNNMRFLRRRYIDPLTGKNEWRLIHVNGSGQLTDSLVTPLGGSGASGASGASGGSGGSGASGASGGFSISGGFSTSQTGPTGASGPPEVNPMVARRPSDRQIDGGPAGNTNPADVDPNDPRYWPPITLTTSGASGASGPQTPNYPGQPGYAQYPGQQLNGQQLPGAVPGQQNGQSPIPGLPGGIPQGIPGQQTPAANPAQPGFNPQMPGQQTFPFPTGTSTNPASALPGQAQAGAQQATPGAAPNPALGMINNMLTNPQQNTQTTTTQNNPLNAGGLAGVASEFKGPSIRLYKTQQKYQLWEFIFDLKSLTGQTTQPQPQQQQNGQGLQNQTQTAAPGAGQTPGASTNPTTPNPNQ
jgi:hypothetical protein